MSTDTNEKNFVEQLFIMYYEGIVDYCTALLNGDVSEGELCANEVFEQATASSEKLQKHPNIVGWLKRTANNRVKRVIRERSKRAKFEVHITDLSENYFAALDYIQDFDESFVSDSDIEKNKLQILSMLTAEQKKLYELRYTEKLTFKEIGKNLNISESAARMRTVNLELHIKKLVADICRD